MLRMIIKGLNFSTSTTYNIVTTCMLLAFVLEMKDVSVVVVGRQSKRFTEPENEDDKTYVPSLFRFR
jgi:hypothetical protein